MKSFAAFLVFAPVLAAQNPPQAEEKPVTMRTMPTVVIGPELRSILNFVGYWDSAETWEKVPGISPGGIGTGRQVVRLGPGGVSVIIDYEAMSGPFRDYSGHGILSWEPGEKIYRVVWAQNVTPGISIETGKMEDGNLVTSYEIMEHGEKYTVRNIYSDRTPNSYTLTNYYVDLRGKQIKNLTMKLRKR